MGGWESGRGQGAGVKGRPGRSEGRSLGGRHGWAGAVVSWAVRGACVQSMLAGWGCGVAGGRGGGWGMQHAVRETVRRNCQLRWTAGVPKPRLQQFCFEQNFSMASHALYEVFLACRRSRVARSMR